MEKCKVTAICNQKGGVGKTTTTVNLGIGLATQGKRVLLVDSDPQGDLTISLGWLDNDDLPMTIVDIMEKVIIKEDFGYSEVILKHHEGVNLLPSNIGLSDMEITLVNTKNREFVLKSCIDRLKQDYDYILIDCPPSLSLLTVNALAAVDSVIIPVEAQFLAAKGMTQLIRTINKIQKKINPSLKIEGVLITFADMRTNLARGVSQTLQQQYGVVIKIYDVHIPIATRAAEACTTGESIFSYDIWCTVALAYEEFTKEVLTDGKEA